MKLLSNSGSSFPEQVAPSWSAKIHVTPAGSLIASCSVTRFGTLLCVTALRSKDWIFFHNIELEVR